MAVADFTAMLEQEPYNSIARTYRGRANAKMVCFRGGGFLNDVVVITVISGSE